MITYPKVAFVIDPIIVPAVWQARCATVPDLVLFSCMKAVAMLTILSLFWVKDYE